MASLTPRFGRSIALFLFVLVLSGSGLAQCLSWDPGFGPPPAGNGFADPYMPVVRALHVHDDGSGPALYAAGRFLTAGGASASSIARWNGTQWSAVGGPVDIHPGSDPTSMATFDEGSGPRLFVGGNFGIVSCGAQQIARWDGASWSALSTDYIHAFIGLGICALAVHDDGTGPALFVGGGIYILTAQGLAQLVSRWDGTQFAPVGTGLGLIPGNVPVLKAFAEFDAGTGAELYAGGSTFALNGADAHGFVKWDGSNWSTVGGGVNGTISALCAFDDGTGPALYVGGYFQTAGGLPFVNIARWNGSSWSAVGAGLPDLYGGAEGVRALAVFDDGGGPALYAAGSIPRGIAKWTGAEWSPLVQAYSIPPSSPAGQGGFHALAAFHGSSSRSLFGGGVFDALGTQPAAGIAEWHGCAGSPGYFCAGDGGEFGCPCNNNGLAGRGCQNSAATGGAQLSVSGTTTPDTLVISILGEVATSTTVVMQGDQTLGFVPFGDGLRCIGGHLRRLYVAAASGGALSVPGPGDPSISARSGALGDPLAAGAVRFYQAQYRDPTPGFCSSGGTFNATNAARVVW